MEDRVTEADYCGLYKTGEPHHWVVVWEEFGPWFERTCGQAFPFPTDSWETRAKVVAAFFRSVAVNAVAPEVSTCTVKVGLCTQEPAHLHVFLEDLVLEGGVSRG